MNELQAQAKRWLCGLLVVSAMAAPCTCMAGAAGAQDVQVLHGGVQEMDHVLRLQRPRTPQLVPTQDAAGVDRTRLKATVDFGDSDFSRTIRQPVFPRMPVMDDTTAPRQERDAEPPALSSNVDDDEVVIAWEAWHKRVCEAIYEQWKMNSRVRGVAHTTLRFTRDCHIFCSITDVTVASVELDRFPPGMGPSANTLEEEFAREIMDTVRSLDGNPLLHFPAKSKRSETSFSPYFKKMGESGYDWRKDDYERVKVN